MTSSPEGTYITYAMAVSTSNLNFSLSIKFDDRPLTRTPHLRRLSLIFKAEGKEELVIRGFLLPQGHKQIIPPSTLVSGKTYDICQLSPALQEAILTSFSYEELYQVRKPEKGVEAWTL